jgi:hypothetical protein
MVRKYREGLSASQILVLFKGKFKTNKTVYDVLRLYGVNTRAPEDYVHVDHNYFGEIDSRAKAYTLGLVLTDGWVQGNQVCFGLQDRDRYIVEYVKEQWETDNKISCIKKKEEGRRDQFRVVVNSKIMVADLRRHGVVERKAHVTFLPFVKRKFVGSLLRGILDGDGCVYQHSQVRKPVLRFNGSAFLCGGISHHLFSRLGVKSRPLPVSTTNLVEVYQPADLKKVVGLLWGDMGEDEMYMRRKYEKVAHLVD